MSYWFWLVLLLLRSCFFFLIGIFSLKCIISQLGHNDHDNIILIKYIENNSCNHKKDWRWFLQQVISNYFVFFKDQLFPFQREEEIRKFCCEWYEFACLALYSDFYRWRIRLRYVCIHIQMWIINWMWIIVHESSIIYYCVQFLSCV